MARHSALIIRQPCFPVRAGPQTIVEQIEKYMMDRLLWSTLGREGSVVSVEAIGEWIRGRRWAPRIGLLE